jgi:hypothetical protein
MDVHLDHPMLLMRPFPAIIFNLPCLQGCVPEAHDMYMVSSEPNGFIGMLGRGSSVELQ